MRLSEAAMLGTTLEMKFGVWNHCLLGNAATAVGIPTWGNLGNGRYRRICEEWPWLLKLEHGDYGATFGYRIWQRFDHEVAEGKITVEQLIDWIREVEPKPLALPAPVYSQIETNTFCETAEVLLK